MYTVAINLKINDKSVSEYVFEVAYTALYFDSHLCVQEAGKDYIRFAIRAEPLLSLLLLSGEEKGKEVSLISILQ